MQIIDLQRLTSLVERSIQLSNQIVKDFKEIADLTYLIPIMEDENASNTPLDKEA